MPNDLYTGRLREGAAEFLDAFNKAKATSIFEGTVQEVDASAGFFKPASLALPGSPSEFTGTATVHAITTTSVSYETKVHEYTWGIDKNLLMRTDSVARGQTSTMLRRIAGKWVGHRDRKLTTLLATGESTGGHDGNGIFGATVATVESGVTVDNIHGTGVSGSAAEVLAAVHEGLALFETMTNPGTDLVHGDAPQVKLMYSPTGQTGERQFVYDAINPMLLNDKYRFEGSEIVPAANGYLGSNADMWLFNMNAADKFFVCGVEQQPDFITNLGSQSDSDVIMHRRNLGQTSYAYECAFSGVPYQAVMLNDA